MKVTARSLESTSTNEVRGQSLRRIQIVLAALFALGAAGAFCLAALRSPDVPFLPRDGTPWIWAATPPSTLAIFLDPTRPFATEFERRFTVNERRGPVTLRFRALQNVALSLNGTLLPLARRDERQWKEPSVLDVTPFVVLGENLLQVEVRNPKGAALLQLRLDGLDEPLRTDERWFAAREGEPLGPAAIADDGVRFHDSTSLPSPLAAAREHWLALTLFAAVGMGGAAILQGRGSLAPKAPSVALGMVALFWIWFFAVKIVSIPARSGFDAADHLAYIEWLLQHKTLPSATHGLEMYHPPLYHTLTALLLAAAGAAPASVAERALLSLLPVLSGLGMAFVAAAMARCLAPEAPWIGAGSAFAAGFLPSNLTLAASVSNELPHAFLASLAILATVRILLKERATPAHDVLLGLLLGVALLTKYTSLILVPTLVAAVAAKRLWAESAPPLRVALGAARTLAVTGLLAGWVYVRNWILFGNPVVSNFNWPTKIMWQYPGFHTASYFLRFGDALTRPWLSGFHGFWDSVYTTLWGDGMLGGAGQVGYMHWRWSYDWMATVFLLALPATLFLLAGWIRAVIEALRDDALGRRLALSLLVALPPLLIASLVAFNLHYPFWSSGKVFYALFLTPTLAYLGVLGFDGLDRALARAPALRVLPWGWALAFFGGIALAYGG